MASEGMCCTVNAAENSYKPDIEVYWRKLKRDDKQIIYRSECPTCKIGTLGVGRDSDTHELQERDYCIWCGQHFKYLDIELMREMDHGKRPMLFRPTT